MWNYHLMLPLINEKVSNDWIIQVIQGYIGNANDTIETRESGLSKNINVDYILLSRRSTKSAGNKQLYKGKQKN
jgi:hypothetical protein